VLIKAFRLPQRKLLRCAARFFKLSYSKKLHVLAQHTTPHTCRLNCDGSVYNPREVAATLQDVLHDYIYYICSSSLHVTSVVDTDTTKQRLSKVVKYNLSKIFCVFYGDLSLLKYSVIPTTVLISGPYLRPCLQSGFFTFFFKLLVECCKRF
jgi:hypothetical protein